jgi:NRPS condensation-like uncharacterized protein
MHAELSDVALYGSMARYGDLLIHGVLDLRRRFSRAALERAAEATIAAFPVMGRRYEPGLWRDRWRPIEGPLSDSVHVVDEPHDLEGETRAWLRRSLDTARERPFRVVSLGRGEGARLILSVTHLAVDGAGAAAVGHVFGSALYGAPPSAPTDPRRSVGSSLEGLRWFHAPSLARGLVAAALQPLRTRAAAVRERHYPAAEAPELRSRTMVIAPPELERLKARCRAHGASINDALVAALARASARRSSGGPLAVLYTMDLRRYAGGARLTAANTSSILTVVVPREAVSDLGTAARAVAAITRRHRRALVGPAFLIGPLLLGTGAPHAAARVITRLLHPLLVDMPLRRGLLVTNVGRIDEGLAAFGDDLESLRVFGPRIEGVPAPAVVAYGFRGALCLQLLAPPGVATEALDELEGELRAGLELEGGRGATDTREGESRC